MREILVDETSFETPQEVHAYLARELDFPTYYGANLDALNDCLGERDEKTSFSLFMADEVVLVAGGEQAAQSMATWFPKLVRSILRAARENDKLEVYVHAGTLDAMARLANCSGVLELLHDDCFMVQAVIARL